jgi:stage V sporulation protein K
VIESFKREEIKVPELPDLGGGAKRVKEWLKKVGDWVHRDEPVVVVEDDVCGYEVGPPTFGVLTELLVRDGDPVVFGQSLAVMEQCNQGEQTDAVMARITARSRAESTAASPRPAATSVDEEGLAAVCRQVNALIGLQRAKRELLETIALIRMARRRVEAGLSSEMGMFHAVFSGNPGTGKTTFARAYAAALKALGVVTGLHVVEVTRADLVAGYSGQTALKTRAVIESALGGVLFLDEAYALVTEDQDAFGREALAELIKAMEDHRSNLVVVLAGYSTEMRNLVAVNPGLKSRILSVVQFDDYSDDELVAIADSIAEAKKYHLDAAAKSLLCGHFGRLRSKDGSREFGNAREARNLIERMIRAHALRLFAIDAPTVEQMMRLDAHDLDDATAGRD